MQVPLEKKIGITISTILQTEASDGINHTQHRRNQFWHPILLYSVFQGVDTTNFLYRTSTISRERGKGIRYLLIDYFLGGVTAKSTVIRKGVDTMGTVTERGALLIINWLINRERIAQYLLQWDKPMYIRCGFVPSTNSIQIKKCRSVELPRGGVNR